MQQLSGRKSGKRRTLIWGGVVAVMVAAWWVVTFNGSTNDESKYERLQSLARSCCRLDSLDQWLPPRVSKFIRLHDFRYREMRKHDLLRIELLTSGYLTNVTFEITNRVMAFPRILSELVKNFGAEARITGITIQTLRGTTELVTFTARTQDLLLLRCIVSGDSNAPAKPIQKIPPLFEGDIPGGGGRGF